MSPSLPYQDEIPYCDECGADDPSTCHCGSLLDRLERLKMNSGEWDVIYLADIITDLVYDLEQLTTKEK